MSNAVVDEKLIEQWEEAYANGKLPEGYEFDGAIKAGRPKMFDGEMTTLTIRIPVAQKTALMSRARKSQQSLSDYSRHLLTLGML